ncbi:DNA segregation ATPase FtsK/SpoIIIE and related proteins [Mycobacteroides abscessus]|nr:FtsK/SpoIIIE domain-containing protein [Mycobacteroides abscessus]CQA08758.1 DNA segregation ATPase FtsK/SpoIIIE and related proteins [Mycobacteroides abscessus]
MNAVNPLSLAGRAAKPAEQPTEPEPKLRLVTPGETTPEPESAQETAAAANAAAEAQERRLTQWVDEYERLLPEIEAARPLPAQQPSEDRQLSGADWIAEGVRQVLTPADPGRFQVEVFVKNGGVFANVTCPPDVRRKAVGNFLAAKIRERGNLGEFEVKRHSDPRIVTLQRRGIEGPGTAWRAHGTRARLFYETEEGQQRVFDLAGLFQTHRSNKKLRRYPAVHSFGADHRGGTVELRLRGGMLLRDVQAKQDALRQALNAPELEVKGRGVFPVIHLNTGAVTRELPKTALLRPELFTRPRTEPERYAVKDFFLPFGVRVDEETGREIPILVPQDVVPHGAVFGGTGSGKTVMLSQLVRAAVLQGAQVLLWDAKRGKDMRNIAREGLPGVVHYAAGSHAVLHRAILWLRDELERRQAIAAALSYRGIDYRPTPILAVLDELPAWLFDLKEEKGDAQKAAERTQAHLNFIASQAREFRIFYVTAGQSAYSDGYAGMIRANTNTLVSLASRSRSTCRTCSTPTPGHAPPRSRPRSRRRTRASACWSMRTPTAPRKSAPTSTHPGRKQSAGSTPRCVRRRSSAGSPTASPAAMPPVPTAAGPTGRPSRSRAVTASPPATWTTRTAARFPPPWSTTPRTGATAPVPVPWPTATRTDPPQETGDHHG